LIRRAELAVASGEVVVIGGAAGIGASRLIAALLGEAPVSEGTISVLGRDLARLRRAALRILRREVGVIPQDLCLLGDRTALLNAILPLEIDGVPRTASLRRAAALLDRLGLAGDGERLVEEMAWSSRQRVAVARALIREPAVLIADQPTSLQDETGSKLVCDAIASAAAAGAAVLVLGRDPLLQREALRRGWRMLTLDDGYLGARIPDSSFDDVSIDMVIDSMSAPVAVAGISVELAIGLGQESEPDRHRSGGSSFALAGGLGQESEPDRHRSGGLSFALAGGLGQESEPDRHRSGGSSFALAGGSSAGTPVPAGDGTDDDEADSDGIPKGVLPFPVSVRSAPPPVRNQNESGQSAVPEPVPDPWQEAEAG
jgi:cell division transport system ATP-binding protein